MSPEGDSPLLIFFMVTHRAVFSRIVRKALILLRTPNKTSPLPGWRGRRQGWGPGWLAALMLFTGVTVAARTDFPPRAATSEVGGKAIHYQTALFGRKYRLDDSRELAAYIKALDAEIERSKKEEPL